MIARLFGEVATNGKVCNAKALNHVMRKPHARIFYTHVRDAYAKLNREGKEKERMILNKKLNKIY